MASIYDKAAIYDLIENDDRYLICKNHWKAVFDNRSIQTFLDVSIGSGSVTLPLSELQVKLSGSDLSETMLESCKKKAAAKNIDIDLQCCDFRAVASRFSQTFDCVASTGNSLPYVTNADVCKTLEQMDALINSGGYLYFDIRNWDKILRERNRFYLYNPIFDGDTRINLIQVWDYHEDDTMTFNLLYTFEKDNQIFRKEKFEERYIPVKKQILLDKLAQMGYEDIEVMNFPVQQPYTNIDDVDWYCVIAKKHN